MKSAANKEVQAGAGRGGYMYLIRVRNLELDIQSVTE